MAKLVTLTPPSRNASTLPPSSHHPAKHKPFPRSDDLEQALHEVIKGEVRFGDGDRALYATDGSNYRQIPIGIVVPRDVEDALATMRLCRMHGAPVLLVKSTLACSLALSLTNCVQPQSDTT